MNRENPLLSVLINNSPNIPETDIAINGLCLRYTLNYCFSTAIAASIPTVLTSDFSSPVAIVKMVSPSKRV